MTTKKKVIVSVAAGVLAIVVIVGTVATIFKVDKGNGDNIPTPSPSQSQEVTATTPTPDINDIDIDLEEVELPTEAPIEEPTYEDLGLPSDFEEPPVPVIYDIANDPNKDGAISKGEWEDWVAKHPEDKNQNMDLSDDVVIETPTPEPTPNPGTSSGNNNSGGTSSGGGTSSNNNSGGTSSGGGTTNSGGTSSGNNNSGGTTSGGGTSGSNNSGGTSSGGGTTTPSTPDNDVGTNILPGDTDISDKDMEAIKNMIEDAGGTYDPTLTQEDVQKIAEEQGGTYDPDTGCIVPDENSGWFF